MTTVNLHNKLNDRENLYRQLPICYREKLVSLMYAKVWNKTNDIDRLLNISLFKIYK